MSIEDKKLQREMTIDNLLKSESRIEWEKEHIICYGMYDDEGVEVFNKYEKLTIEAITEISEVLKLYSLRARFNTSRNIITYLMWLHKNSAQKMDEILHEKDYVGAKEFLLNQGHAC